MSEIPDKLWLRKDLSGYALNVKLTDDYIGYYRWVAVSERLPEYDPESRDEILSALEWDNISICWRLHDCYIDEDGMFHSFSEDEQIIDALYWSIAKLPPAPKPHE